MKNKQDNRNNFLKNKIHSTTMLSFGIAVLMMLTALPIYVAQISSTPIVQVNTSSVLATDGFGNLVTAGITCDCDFDDDGYDRYEPCNCYGDDCNDNDPSIHPGAPEICDDGVDNDCDGLVDCADRDCDFDGDGICCCDDNCPATYNPGQEDTDGDGVGDACDTEDCDDGMDNDGDGDTDCDDSECDCCDCVDSDQDQHFAISPNCPTGDDCDDTNPAVYPGAPEICDDGVDNDCDGLVDCADRDCDFDGDGICCCDDNCPATYNPGQEDTDGDGVGDACECCNEICDGIDNDGDCLIDEGFPDTDGDGIADCVDIETCDGEDNDGDGMIDEGCDDRSKEAPTTILFYPTGGETLKGTVTVQYFVHDSQDEHWSELPIYLYYLDDANNWYLISIKSKGPQLDHIFLGEFTWNTNSLQDGTYRLLLEAIDSDGNIGNDMSDYFLIRNYETQPTNDPPNQPTRPYGSTGGNTDVEYTYTSITSDPDSDQIWYLFDWGDNSDSGWLGPYTSSETCEAKHTWQEKNTYNIIVKAKDTSGKESSWSDPLPITIQYSFNNLIQQYLEQLFQRYPNAFPVLRQLMGD